METISVLQVEVIARFDATKVKNWPKLSRELLKLPRAQSTGNSHSCCELTFVYTNTREAMSMNISDRVRATWLIEEDRK